MWSKLPIIGWVLGFLIAVFMAIPFYFLWNFIAPIYLTFLPQIWLSLPFWNCVWLFLLISIIKSILFSGIFSNDIDLNIETKK